MAKLTFLLSTGEVAHELSGSSISIGRRSDNAVHVSDPTISGHHARITVDAGKYYIDDLNSTNGTFVNGAQVKRSELKDSDKVRLGLVDGVFKVGIAQPGVLPKPPRPLGVRMAA